MHFEVKDPHLVDCHFYRYSRKQNGNLFDFLSSVLYESHFDVCLHFHLHHVTFV